nr:L-threonylcarbamoyladenylate synthase [Bacillus alkalicellulosilyticus]
MDNVSGDLKKLSVIKDAALWIKNGEVVAFPTETVYGLGGNVFLDEAISQIFEAKGRPQDNPLIIHIASKSQALDLIGAPPAYAELLMDQFWPGPLTLVCVSKQKVSEYVTAGLHTVAIRVPDHPVALALIEEAGVPIAAPSANRSGKPSPTTACHVFHDLNGKIMAIVDGGSTGVGVESTVVDCTGEIPIILRPGGVTKEQIEQVVGTVGIDKALFEKSAAPKSPGMKYTHYAPNAPLQLVEGGTERIQQLIIEKQGEGMRVGVLATEESQTSYQADVVLACGQRAHLQTVAQKLYEVLRVFDEENVDVIFSETFPQEGVGLAIMNRLEKAASGIIIR